MAYDGKLIPVPYTDTVRYVSSISGIDVDSAGLDAIPHPPNTFATLAPVRFCSLQDISPRYKEQLNSDFIGGP